MWGKKKYSAVRVEMQNQGRRFPAWPAGLDPLSIMGCRRTAGRKPGKEEQSSEGSFKKEKRVLHVLCCKEIK